MPRLDRDSPWKDILREYFREAIQFFFPQTATRIDWNRTPEFLDKEFQQIAPDAEIGKRYADQLVKVWLKHGQEAWLLIHVEIQAKSEAYFAERMLIYHLRIFDRFHSHPISLAILCDYNSKWRPHQYQFSVPDTELLFRFGSVKLLDYQNQWSALEQSRNPFAVVVMAHLKTQETRNDSRQRKDWKLSLIRQLYETGYDRQAIISLFRFIDWVMILPEGLSREFWQALKTYEEEKRMPYISSVERFGYQEGLQKGLQEGLETGRQEGLQTGRQEGLQTGRQEGLQAGRQEGERSLVLLLLRQKFGDLPDPICDRITDLNLDAIEALALALPNLPTLAELEAWLHQTE